MSSINKPIAPLADRLRPTNWHDVLGQDHLLGQGKPLRLAFESGKPHSMILWGPPGVGKTTLARLSAQAFDYEWIALSAVFSGVKDIRGAIEQAKINLAKERQTIVFIDEIHRFNKSQQDALLPFTESGLITFIGATTENPSFEVNAALLSRAKVYVLKPLTPSVLRTLIRRIQQSNLFSFEIEEPAIDLLIAAADGDARRLLNTIEHISYAAKMHPSTSINLNFVEQILSESYRRFDKSGDYFYDQISALHKSVRGSHPDAALYWLCRMLDGGADPRYLARRIIRMAWEDIGLADPRAIQLAENAMMTYERLGSPEGELALAEAVIYLAVAAKSNASYLAFKQAMQFVKQDQSRDVPLHLRNAPTQLTKNRGHGKHYHYPHDEPDAYVRGEHYLPDGFSEPNWYKPVNRGLEKKIAEKMAYLRSLDQTKDNHLKTDDGTVDN